MKYRPKEVEGEPALYWKERTIEAHEDEDEGVQLCPRDVPSSYRVERLEQEKRKRKRKRKEATSSSGRWSEPESNQVLDQNQINSELFDDMRSKSQAGDTPTTRR